MSSLAERRVEPLLVDGFTAHNIVLPDGSETKPGSGAIAEYAVTRSALRMARTIRPPTGAAPAPRGRPRLPRRAATRSSCPRRL